MRESRAILAGRRAARKVEPAFDVSTSSGRSIDTERPDEYRPTPLKRGSHLPVTLAGPNAAAQVEMLADFAHARAVLPRTTKHEAR